MTYEDLYRQYFATIERYCFYIVNNSFFSEELASEAFHLLLLKWDTLRCHESPVLLAWLYKTANLKAKELSRKQPSVTVSLSEEEGINQLELYLLSNGSAIDGYLENQKYKNYIDKIQKHLNSEDWELFEYILIKQFSYKKLGTIYHSSEAAIKMRWYRLQRKLRPFVDFITK